MGTPGYRHAIGLARVWHFIDVHGFIVTGLVFIAMLFHTDQWKRIVPTSRSPRELVIIEVAVFLLVAQALVINRFAGLPYPLWNASTEDVNDRLE